MKRYHPKEDEPDPREPSQPARPKVPLFPQPEQVDSPVQPTQADSPVQPVDSPAQALKVQPLPMKSVTSVFEGTNDMVKIVTSGVESGA